LFKIIIKRGERGQKIGCKIAKKKRKEGMQNCTIGKKIGGKSAIKHKKVHLTRKGAKIWGAKSLKKKEGVQNRTISKR